MRSYSSDVYNQLRLMQPRFTLFYQERRRFESHLRTLSSEERSEQQNNGPHFTYPEPFRNFYVEFNFQHPYWRQMTLDMSGPSFNESYNIEENYLTSYRLKFSTMEQLARDIMSFAFPNAGTVSAQTDIDSPQMDVVETLKRYKELVDMGVLTEEEFANKKRQLLGL